MSFSIGDFAFDKISGVNVQIIEKSDIWDFISYTVINRSTNNVYLVSLDQLEHAKNTEDADIWFIRYLSVLYWLKNQKTKGIISTISKTIIPLPHQMHVLNRAISRDEVRYILADEVGLGKTIEAGLIIEELKARGLVKRVLIVCPKGLVTQWQTEMNQKFSEDYQIILPENFEIIKKFINKTDIYSHFDQVISPMDSIKPLEKRSGWSDEKIEKYNKDRIYSIVDNSWDLIVIDEAHRVAGSSNEISRYKLGSLLAKSSPYLLLLTATPHNGKTEPFLRLVKLIDDKAFPNQKAIVKEQVSPFIIRTEKREAIDNEGNSLFKNRNTKIIELRWDNRHSLQRELYELTSDYVSKSYNLYLRNQGKNSWVIFLLIMMQRLVTSSTHAIRISLEKRVQVLMDESFSLINNSDEDILDQEIEEKMDDAILSMPIDMVNEISELNSIIRIAKQAEYQYTDVKVEPLLEIINNIMVEDISAKIIVFTEFVATQNYLKTLLQKHKITCSLLNGSMNIELRNQVLEEFRNKTQVLISTDAGGEGLNLQFSNVVINYDLPWNPMKIEQRIGRVDRIGQTKDVKIFNFVLADTVEKRVRDILEEKLSVILEESGMDKYSDVLDNEQSTTFFLEAYLKSIQDPSNIEKNTISIVDEFTNQISNYKNLKDIISEEKNLVDLVKIKNKYETSFLIEILFKYYSRIKGNTTSKPDSFSIQDKDVQLHLNYHFEKKNHRQIQKIKIKDFPNEKGYFSIWEVSINNRVSGSKIVPVFVNSSLILRPIAGQLIWEQLLLNPEISVVSDITIEDFDFNRIDSVIKDYLYNSYLELKNDYQAQIEADFKKNSYALNLRIEAANNIGIENIKRKKLKDLDSEKKKITQFFETAQKIFPTAKLIISLELEG